MNIPVYNTKNQKVADKALPTQFSEPIRVDIIKRAVLNLQKNKMSPYGSDPRAGKRASVMLSKRRRHFRGAYGRASSRVPRKVMTKRGTQFNLTAAFAPGTVKGRQAHPPKAWKDFTIKINEKERQKAIRSALAASISKQYLAKRNHQIPTTFPFLIASEFESLAKTKDVITALNTLGFEKEIERTSSKTIQSGKAKLRGRRYVIKKGPLFVVSKDCPLLKSARNIQGCNVAIINNLNAEDLAPGSHPGRLTLYTDAAIDTLHKQNLFYPKTLQMQTEQAAKKAAAKPTAELAKFKKAPKTEKPVEKPVKTEKAEKPAKTKK